MEYLVLTEEKINENLEYIKESFSNVIEYNKEAFAQLVNTLTDFDNPFQPRFLTSYQGYGYSYGHLPEEIVESQIKFFDAFAELAFDLMDNPLDEDGEYTDECILNDLCIDLLPLFYKMCVIPKYIEESGDEIFIEYFEKEKLRIQNLSYIDFLDTYANKELIEWINEDEYVNEDPKGFYKAKKKAYDETMKLISLHKEVFSWFEEALFDRICYNY